MSYATQSETSITVGQGLLERVTFSTLTTLPCCIFFSINVTMLFTLNSKLVFRETPRYILLFNVLLADTLQMVLSMLLYLLSVCRVRLTYPVCGLLVMFTSLTSKTSPLTLVVMSVERFVAVCYPLRHSAIITIRNTAVAILVVWALSFLNVLIQVILMLDFPFEDLVSLQMKDSCNSFLMYLVPVSALYDKSYTYCLFVLAGLAVVFSYTGVVVAARSASTNKASAYKARNTLLLHLVQLGLSLSSTMHSVLLLVISKMVSRRELGRVQNVFYVFIIILPRCLSPLIYGLRDRTIRTALVYYLCCGLRLPFPQHKSHSKILYV